MPSPPQGSGSHDPGIAPECLIAAHAKTAALMARVQQLESALRARSEALAEREAELAAVMTGSPLLQGVLSPDGTVLRVTERILEVTGVAADDVIGTRVWNIAWWPTAEARAAVEDAVRRAATTGRPVHWRCTFSAASNERHHGDFTLQPVLAANGRVRLLHATARDTTEEEEMRTALAQGERRYRLLLANLPGIMFRAEATAPWYVHYVSEGVRRLTGYPVEHFVRGGHPFGSIVLEEDRERLARTLASQAAAGEPLRCEYRIRHRDGTIRWVEGQARPAEDDPSLFDGTIFDIDDRKRAELALQEGQTHFHYITQNSPSVLWTARSDGKIEFISDAYIQQFGRAARELLEDGWLSLLHPDDLPTVEARWSHSLRTGEPYEIRFRLRDSQDCYRSFQASGHCRRDDAGRITRWYGVLTNVDELVRTQAQLRESDELARATLETCPGIVWRALPSGRVDFVSEGCTTQLGWTPAQIIDGQWSRLLHPDEVEAVSQRYQRALETGQDFASRHRFRCADGRFQWFQVHATARRDAQGRIQRWYGLATCIEELLQARIHAETAARAKAAFLSTMSHEIRTPLNAVLGFAGLLAESDLGAQQRDCVNAIRTSGSHLLGVINDILDFSKLESGGVALDYGACELRGLVESALDLVASQAAAKGLELCCSFDDELPAAALVDGARLRQVLANLLSNAVKFTERGEIEVRATARALGDGEVELRFSVRDTGPGMTSAAVERLFRDFSQGDDSIARRFGGTGLGLAISKRLVQAHGGTIDVESRPGEGSVFRFRVPAQTCAPPPVDALASTETLRGRRVLVVDDHRPTLQAIGRHLRQWGVEAALVADPCVAALTAERAAADGVPFDVALVDQRMPQRDGITVARELEAGAGVPVVLVCEWGGTLGAQQAAGEAIVAVQTKPLHRAALLESLLQGMSLPPARRAVVSEAGRAMPPLRLLLVEDNAVNRKLALLLLRKLGYADPDVAVDGLDALDAIARRPYDVVLMDVQMPRLDGLSATRQIRAQALPWPQPEIIAMTANALEEDREACLASGMNAYLSKPIASGQLESALRHAAARRGRAGTNPAPGR